MPLKAARVDTNAGKKGPSKSGVPIIEVEGDIAARYNQVAARIKALEAQKKELGAELNDLARIAYFEHRLANPSSDDSSIKVVDEKEGVTRFDFKDVYSVLDAANAEDLFDHQLNELFPGREVPFDVNAFVVETVVGKFDSAFFLKEDGDFDKALYEKLTRAIEGVVKGSGKDNPFTTEKVVKLKPGFHDTRFKLFPSMEAQQRITETCKNTQALTPTHTPEEKIDLDTPVTETVTKAKAKRKASSKA